MRATVLDPPQVSPQYSEGTTLSVHCRGRRDAVLGAMTIRTRLRRTDRHRGDTGVAAGQAADLEAAATALSSLSFGLMFVDQLVFGADCARLKRVTHVAAGVRRRFGAEAVRRAARVR